MNSSRAKFFPKTRHFGFKRPVFFEQTQKESDSDTDENEENKISEPEASPPPQKINLKPLSFNISSELLPVQNDEPSIPSFDWIDNDSDKFDDLSNDSFSFFEDADIYDSLNGNIDSVI